MSVLIVPDSLRHAINAKLDAALADAPDAEKYRDMLYHELLWFFSDHGYLPENFSIVKKAVQ